MFNYFKNKLRNLVKTRHSLPDYNVVSLQQKNLLANYKNIDKNRLPSINDVGFSLYSDSDEDGIILYIFSLIEFESKKVIDIGAGNGLLGSNSANLILHHGFQGLLFDADEERLHKCEKIYKEHPLSRDLPPTCINTMVTSTNINDLIQTTGFTGALDLLLIDIDSIDYWVWKSIDIVRPRLVVLEIQCIWGARDSLTVPENFTGTIFDGQYAIYNSASLKAFEKLAKEKGYHLIGTQKLGFNAFFLRNDLAHDALPIQTVEECLNKPFTKWAQEYFSQKIRQYDWQEV